MPFFFPIFLHQTAFPGWKIFPFQLDLTGILHQVKLSSFRGKPHDYQHITLIKDSKMNV